MSTIIQTFITGALLGACVNAGIIPVWAAVVVGCVYLLLLRCR